jgi:hypothetical protein
MKKFVKQKRSKTMYRKIHLQSFLECHLVPFSNIFEKYEKNIITFFTDFWILIKPVSFMYLYNHLFIYNNFKFWF